MKNILHLVLVLILTTSLSNCFAQSDGEKHKTEIELKIEKENGETRVTLIETIGDDVKTTVMTGEEAEEYLEDHHEKNSFYFNSDDDGSGESVIIMEIDKGDGHAYTWTSDMDELENELEALRDELENLNTDEIAERLDEIIVMREELCNIKHINFESLHHEMGELHEIMDNININVEEVDGKIIITKRIGNTETIEEIDIDAYNKHMQVYVITKSSGDKDDSEVRKHALADDLELTVYPTPNDGNFTIELALETDEAATISVIDSSGKEVYQRTVKGINTHKLDIQLKKPSAGMYVVTVEQGNKTVKIKTIIE